MQPVVVEQVRGEKSAVVAQRIPTAPLIGSRWNVAMLANTLTPSTRLRQADGTFLKLGRNYKDHFNAK